MLLNYTVAVSSPAILLIPYERSHVFEYHRWMQNVELRTATASEHLSLAEEYEMQESWRKDGDKLTFISCLPRASNQGASVVAGVDDAVHRMLGDVNLFLTTPDEQNDEEAKGQVDIIGEVELMIALEENRGKGHGKAALEAFLQYIASHEEEIIDAFTNGFGTTENLNIKYLRVKIGEKNKQSLRLFENMGFARTQEGVNWFGEVELRSENWRNLKIPGWRKVPIAMDRRS